MLLLRLDGVSIYQDTTSWNAVNVGYANHRKGYKVFNCLEEMQKLSAICLK